MTKANYDTELTAGQMLGRYELLVPIAKGGMGNVWAARLKGTRGFRKLVAIKTILRTLERSGLEQMLYQEAVLASQIHHPNVAETLELGEHEGTLYLVMELVSGESLRFILREGQARGGIPLSVCINVIAQVCRGLAAAHDLRDESGECVGLVHRDISPPNVMITDAGAVKIVDFGVATTSSNDSDVPGQIKGKISYLAPEQLRGEPLDARVDVFATGILLYLLTVGSHPFRAASDTSTIARILSKSPATTPSSLVKDYPEALEQIVMRALHKDRERRFQSIAEMLQAIEDAFPSAFGPRADEAAALYLRRLMKDRVAERKATLRMAEELAERSSPSHSAYSLPVVTTSSAPQPKSHRAALVGVGGLFTGLGIAALAVTLYLQWLRPAPLPSSASLSPRAAIPAVNSMDAALSQRDTAIAGGSGTLVAALAPTSKPLAVVSTPRAKRALARQSAQEEQAELAELAPDEPPPPAAPPAPEVEARAEAEPALVGSRPRADEANASRSLATLGPVPIVAPLPSAKAAPVIPRHLSSKLGQSQLLTNPASDGSRVRLPTGLNRTSETFSAIVNICVTSTGTVSKVNILRSAGPALDRQIQNALSQWHYRPLLESGTATPFCYVLNYEISAR